MTEDDRRPRTTLRLTVNGEPFCEAEDLTTVTMIVEQVPRRDERKITLYASAGQGLLHWMTASLRVGDQILFEVDEAVTERRAEHQRCDFCGLEMDDVSALMQGQSGSICNGCITSLSHAIHKGSPLPLGAAFRDDCDLPCRFCEVRPPAISGVVVRNGAAICAQCLRTAADILGEQA